MEIVVKGRKVATHRREFQRKEKRETPSYREHLLARPPQFKYQRIYQLMKGMARELDDFLQRTEQEGENPLVAAYELFKLLKGNSRETLLSAIRRKSSRRANLVDIFDVLERFFSELGSHLIKIDKFESI